MTVLRFCDSVFFPFLSSIAKKRAFLVVVYMYTPAHNHNVFVSRRMNSNSGIK